MCRSLNQLAKMRSVLAVLQGSESILSSQYVAKALIPSWIYIDSNINGSFTPMYLLHVQSRKKVRHFVRIFMA